MATPESAGSVALARIVADDALMAAIPPDAARKIEDELYRRDEEAKAERIQAEKDNVVKGKRGFYSLFSIALCGHQFFQMNSSRKIFVVLFIRV